MSERVSLVDRIQQDLTAAMKAREAERTSALRMAKAALMNREIEKRSPLDDAEAARVLQALVRQREDSVFQFRRANRPELVQKEENEITLLRSYLPAEASEADIQAAVEKAVAETGAASPKDMGKAMKAALAALEAQGTPADGRKVSDAMRKRLGG
ncbi:MAG: glutamyl-tRNA amidotransferase [Acidobacteria bacterium]|nr:MAG: glutamyl-tRNA amidotransferase [Acidobacteriota bacterium]